MKRRFPNLKRINRKQGFFLGALLFLLIALAFGLKSLQGPAEGDVYTPSQGGTIDSPAYTELDGKSIVFSYPADYRLQPEGKDQPNVTEYYTFRKTLEGRPGTLTLAVSLNKLNGSTLEEYGGYRIRSEQPDIYHSRLSSINGYPFTIFKKKDGSEAVAFTQRGETVAAIAISGTLAATNQSEAEFTAILNSWQWKD